MALYTTPDGRVVIGTGVSDGNDYHGYNGKRDIVIQLTADGATDDGLNALEYLKAYATNAKAENKPIFPDGTRVFISTNGYTKAVEADDVVINGDNITIGGIAWNGSAWDFSNAGQSGGGSGGGGIEVVRFDYDGEEWSADKTYQELIAANTAGKTIIGIEDLDNSSVACGVVSVNEIYFTFFYDAKGTVSMKQLYYASDGTITANV